MTAKLDDYLNGVGNGFVWANAELQGRNLHPLFCQPKMALTQDNFVALFVGESKHRSNANTEWAENSPIELVLLTALESAFPCK